MQTYKDYKLLACRSIKRSVASGNPGHTVSAESLLPDESRVQVILNAPAPSDGSTLRSLRGLMSWYSIRLFLVLPLL